MAISLRRPLALASVVTATLAGAVVLRSLTNDGSDPAPSESTPPPVATTAGVSTTPPLVAREVPSVLEKRVFAAGEAVTVNHGIGFLSAADGSLETWSFPAAGANVYPLWATPDGALLVFSDGKEGSAQLVIDRSTNKTWQLPAGSSPVVNAAHGTAMLISVVANGRREFAVVNLGTGTFRLTGVAADGRWGEGVTSPDGRKAALAVDGSVYLFELATGQAQSVVSGLDPESNAIEALPGALGLAVNRASSAMRGWYNWDGAEVPGGLPQGSVSPNGKYLAAAWTPGPVKAVGMGGYPAVEALLITDRQPNLPVSQVLSANIATFNASPWTSASDALVVEVASGYKLVSPTGQVLASLDDPFHVLAPSPSPTIAGLLGTNRGTIVNTARNQTITPMYAELPWRAKWTTKPGELVVELRTPGKGRSWIEAVLPFESHPGTSRVPPAAVVRAGEDCLNLREKPEAGAPSLRCMPEGTVANFEATDDPNPDPKSAGSGEPVRQYAGFEDANLTVWLHLKLADGTSGWADSKFLGWAK